jgi:transposase-like protein
MKESKKSLKYKRERRYFSEDFRRARVKEYEEGQTSVSEICRVYQVSHGAVYKWIRKYSAHYQKSIVKVVEQKSETKKRLALEKRVSELEQLIGQQQVQIKYYEKLLELIQQHYNVDFEKNSGWKSLNGFSLTDPNTP